MAKTRLTFHEYSIIKNARQLRLKPLIVRASIFLFKSKPRPTEQRTQFPASSNR
ncbi:MAG: hypothetical protein WCP79_13890 [Bacillota bacterium]